MARCFLVGELMGLECLTLCRDITGEVSLYRVSCNEANLYCETEALGSHRYWSCLIPTELLGFCWADYLADYST